MNKYLITLTPIDTFFFGGEITFTRGRKEFKKNEKLSEEEEELKTFNKSFSSYIVKSNRFPQQTSLLGMLRFLILSNNDTLFDASENRIRTGMQNDVAEEIGNKSFELNTGNYGKMDFKNIHSLSPCFLQRQTDSAEWINLFCSSADYGLNKVSFKDGKSFLSEKSKYIPILEGYEAKNGLKTCYLGEKTNLEESQLFAEDARIGINKDYSGKTQVNAFYKQIFYRFPEKYKKNENANKLSDQKLRFAFYADLDYHFNKEKYIVSLGGDDSRFVLQAECIAKNVENNDLTESFEKILPQDYFKTNNFDCYGKVILLSDTFLEKQDVMNSIFNISETISFRFLTSTVHTKNYYKFSGNDRVERSNKKYNLYQKGSVFYFDNKEDLETFEKALKAKERFYQIGYNYFKTIKK